MKLVGYKYDNLYDHASLQRHLAKCNLQFLPQPGPTRDPVHVTTFRLAELNGGRLNLEKGPVVALGKKTVF